MFGFFFNAEKDIDDLGQVMKGDVERFRRFYHLMLEQGIYLAPSQFEAAFVSTAHTTRDIDQTIKAAAAAFKKL